MNSCSAGCLVSLGFLEARVLHHLHHTNTRAGEIDAQMVFLQVENQVNPQLLNGVVLEELETCNVQSADEAPRGFSDVDMSVVPNERLLL